MDRSEEDDESANEQLIELTSVDLEDTPFEEEEEERGEEEKETQSMVELPEELEKHVSPVVGQIRVLYERNKALRHKTETILNFISFWIFGLVNNSVYVVMLSAAVDMLEDTPGVPTSAVLIADIVPTLLIKLIAPLFVDRLGKYIFRIIFNVVFAVAAFVVVAWSPWVSLKLFGVVLGSISAGFGEITFLAYSAYYSKSTIAAWSSGTGMAGVFGAFSYMALTSWLSLEIWLSLTMLSLFPLLILFCYFFVLVRPEKEKVRDTDPEMEEFPKHLPFKKRFTLIFPLLKFLIPLFVVYFSEYTINQGIVPTIYFGDNWMSKRDHYVYYQTLYQLGVLTSRSSVLLFSINQIWVFGILQALNLVVILIHALSPYIPNVFILFAIILWEGLLGGFTYVNAFHHIRTDIDPRYREYSLGVTSISDSLGITCAGVVSLFIEPLIVRWQDDHGVRQ